MTRGIALLTTLSMMACACSEIASTEARPPSPDAEISDASVAHCFEYRDSRLGSCQWNYYTCRATCLADGGVAAYVGAPCMGYARGCFAGCVVIDSARVEHHYAVDATVPTPSCDCRCMADNSAPECDGGDIGRCLLGGSP